MNSRKLFHSIGEIEDRFIDEASGNYTGYDSTYQGVCY